MRPVHGLLVAAGAILALPGPNPAENPPKQEPPAKVLAEAPIDRDIHVKIKGFDGNGKVDEREGRLVRITEKGLLFVDAHNREHPYTTEHAEPRGNQLPRLTAITATDGTKALAWKYDAETKRFVGDVVPPPEVPDVTPLPSTPAQKRQAAYAAVEYLHQTWRQRGPLGDDKDVRDKAAAYEDFAKTVVQDAALVAALKDFRRTLDHAREYRAAREKAIAKLDQAERQLVRDAEANRWAVLRDAAAVGDEAAARSEEPGLAFLIGFGFSGLVGNALVDADQQRRLDALNKEFVRELAGLDKAYAAAVRAARERFHDAAGGVAGLPGFAAVEKADAAVAACLEKADFAQAARLLGARTKDNPFQAVLYYRLLSLVPGDPDAPRRQAAEMIRHARAALLACRALPADGVFDADRLSLLSQACQIACDAATVELRKASWFTAHNAKAAYAARLIETCLGPNNVVDPAGLYRQMLLVAYLQSGRLDDARQLAARIAPLRQNVASFAWIRCRMAIHQKAWRDAVDHCRTAFREGFLYAGEFDRHVDFAPLRAWVGPNDQKLKAELNQLLAVTVQFRLVPDGARLNLVCTNRSSLTLTECTPGLIAATRRHVMAPHAQRLLPPGSSCVWYDVFGGQPGFNFLSGVLKTTQGTGNGTVTR